MRYGLILVGSLVLAGCLTPREVTPVARYALSPTLEVAKSAPTDLSLGMRELKAARPYRQAMVFLDAGSHMGQRAKQEWAERPDEVLGRAILDAVAQSGRFADCGNAAEMARPDLILTGEVRRFEEDRTTSPWTAVVEVRIEIRRARDVGLVWGETLVAREPMAGEAASDAAAAMETAIARVAERVAAGVAAAG